MATKPRILLVGSGGVGGVVAALLTRAGIDLTVVTGNPEIRDAIRDRGLRIRELSGDEWTVRLKSEPVARLDELSTSAAARYDLCLLATKSTNLDQVLSDVAPLLSPRGSVVCMQNGLPEERAVAVLGAQRVIGCIVSWGATLLGPGHLARTSAGGFQLGRIHQVPAPDTTLATAAALLGRVLPTRTIANLAGTRWSKLAINCATSTLGAAGGDTLGRLLRRRIVRRLALEIWAELCAVAQASGVQLAPVMGKLDIRSLALTAADRQRKVGSLGLFGKHALLLAMAFRYRKMRSSMLVAIERGRMPEIDYLNGEIVRRGAALGIKTPLNAALVELIHAIVAKQSEPGVQTLNDLYQRYHEST